MESGNLIDMVDITVYPSIVNNISAHILYVISHKVYTKQLCGDIGNDSPNLYTNENVFV